MFQRKTDSLPSETRRNSNRHQDRSDFTIQCLFLNPGNMQGQDDREQSRIIDDILQFESFH